MNDLATTSIRSDMPGSIKEMQLLESLSNLYGVVSALFADPDSEKFFMLLKPDIQDGILDSCLNLEESIVDECHYLSPVFKDISKRLDESQLEKIQCEYIDVFGHTLSKKIAPYALEHLKNSDVFFRTQKLADLNGFYKAFGLEVESIERADHISTQAEFLSYLLLKVVLAERDGLIEEMSICKDAFDRFQKDHFFNWATMFAENTVNKVEGAFYPMAGRFLSGLLEIEKYYGNSTLMEETVKTK